MTVILTIMVKYVAPFLMGASMAAAATYGDAASIVAMLFAACLWFFSNAVRVAR